jgi:hypothetical protein
MNRRSRLACRLKAASALFACWSILCSCNNLRSSAKDPSTTGDSPSTTRGTTGPVQNVPYCPGGNRGNACLLGANCRITEQGCQVCQCLEL